MRLSGDTYIGSIKSSPHNRRRTGGALDTASSPYTPASPTYCPPPTTTTSAYPYTTLEIENSKTKYKLDQLRLVMQQKKERREARKLKNAPYNISGGHNIPVANLSPTTSTTTTITAVASPSGTVPPPATSPSSNVDSLVEEVDTVA